MAQNVSIDYRKPLQWGEQDPHRRENTSVGMWAWLLQRISALAIVVFIGLHVAVTYSRLTQLMLLLAVTFHAALGLRVILLDFNIVNVKYQRTLVWSLIGLGAIVMGTIWYSTYFMA